MSTVLKGGQLKGWKYLLGALFTLIILIPLWTIFVMMVIQPDSLMTQEQTMGNRLLWWIATPVTLVTLAFGGQWLLAKQNGQVHASQVEQVQTQQTVTSEQDQREYVLEVIGLGVTLDKYRQGALWDALQSGSPYTTVREQDPKKYDWSARDKRGTSGGRALDALENGAKDTPMYWGVPSFFAGAPTPGKMPETNRPVSGLVGSADTTGMAWHLFTVAPWRLDERPDRLLEQVFAFFDTYPDVPYVVLSSVDSMGTRHSKRPVGAPGLLKDGYYIPEMPDASAVFVLARRERVDPLRPFVWNDPDNEFVQAKLINMYYQLQHAVPHPDRKKIIRTPAQVGADPSDADHTDPVARQPTVAEWLEAAAAFAQRPDIRGNGTFSTLDLNPFDHHPPRDWKPTPWFPIPWNREQLETFDRLPTLGYLHRPTFVKLTDEEGKPLTRRTDREKALQAGWQQALQTLSEAERAKSPVRVIAAAGDSERLIPLYDVLTQQAEQGGPEIDMNKSSEFIDTDRRLGDTGAATLFMQMAIGVMGSYRDGGVSAAVNLRDSSEASIVLISPPPEDKRRDYVFKSRVTPAIDPANYAQ